MAIVAALSFGVETTSAATAPASASAPAAAHRSIDVDPVAPSDTVTEFYPESANLSDCLGLVEKPGCGSDARGGWRQTLVFVVLFAGLGVILWRIARGISANRAALDAEASPTPDHQ